MKFGCIFVARTFSITQTSRICRDKSARLFRTQVCRRGPLLRLAILTALTSLTSVSAFPRSAQADDSSNRLRLFSGSALEKAEQRHRGTDGKKSATFGSSTSINDAAELDTVDDILEDRKGEDFFARYRAPFYMTYVYDTLPIGDPDEAESRGLAERALVFQAATTFSRAVVKSTLEPLYRDAIEHLKTFRDYTSLKVRQDEDGGLGVDHDGESEKPVLEFKLSVGMNYGVEPRIELGDHCSFRYDMFRQTTFFEIRQDF